MSGKSAPAKAGEPSPIGLG